jgi:inhibitor of KinA
MISLEPLGDQAALLRFADEVQAARCAAAVRASAVPWLIDIVQAYQTVAVFFEPARVRFAEVAAALRHLDTSVPMDAALPASTLHQIPCCYELALDLDRVARHTELSPEVVIRLHAGHEYTVYAIGFCPGFPYLGYLPKELQGVPRLDSPRTAVEKGSIGMTGRQTGIYSEPRPGGWNIIGRTPLELVNVRDGYFPIRTGDRVMFQAISEEEYRVLRGRRL